MNQKTAVMLIGFGGPEGMGDVKPFLESVLRGVNIPQVRFDEVFAHYEHFGGVSPYNAITYTQKKALEEEFQRRGVDLPVFVGFRHSKPSLEDALLQLKQQNVRKVIGFVLASLRSHASFEKYIERVEEAKIQTNAAGIEFVYTDAFYEHPLFIEAQADEALKAMSNISAEEMKHTYFIFSAHSIPSPMAEASGYDRQHEKVSSLIAEKIGAPAWAVAYQSRSGRPSDPWLEPSVEKVIESLDRAKYQSVVLVSAGFLCDNIEVLYDLDCECRLLCEKLGLAYHRAKTVTAHPKFIRLAADLIEAKR